MKANISEGVAPLPPEARVKEIPYSVVWHLLNAKIHRHYRGSDSVALELDGDFRVMHADDYKTVRDIAMDIAGKLDIQLVSPRQWMVAHQMAQQRLEGRGDERRGKRGVVMLKDKGGAGYWRMVLPAKHMEGGDFWVDITASEMKFEHLLEYDSVFVQRIHDWESYYILEKLKKAGKRIVYDLDDDLFNITPDNPAFHVIGRDQQLAAVACMKLADCVTTTTGELQNRIAQVLDGQYPTIIPNALDPADNWLPTEETGSPDGNLRLFWQGSSTHEEDWGECIEAVDVVMKQHTNLRLVILGYLPIVVQERIGKAHWRGKVEHLGFSSTETYFELIKHVRAEAGLAPLRSTTFNGAKSPIKFVECSVIGMPTVASNTLPYSGVIEDGEDGFLCSTADEWIVALNTCLEKADVRKGLVAKAREKVDYAFDIKKVAQEWKSVLLP